MATYRVIKTISTTAESDFMSDNLASGINSPHTLQIEENAGDLTYDFTGDFSVDDISYLETIGGYGLG